jgi:hypothetical protein
MTTAVDFRTEIHLRMGWNQSRRARWSVGQWLSELDISRFHDEGTLDTLPPAIRVYYRGASWLRGSEPPARGKWSQIDLYFTNGCDCDGTNLGACGCEGREWSLCSAEYLSELLPAERIGRILCLLILGRDPADDLPRVPLCDTVVGRLLSFPEPVAAHRAQVDALLAERQPSDLWDEDIESGEGAGSYEEIGR